jgi:hypothetical protein
MSQPDPAVDHPSHYGGDGNPYEAIRVIEAWGLGFSTGNCIKYICRADHKGNRLQDLLKAAWYLQHEIDKERAKTDKTVTLSSGSSIS